MVKFTRLRPTIMRKLDLFRSCLSSALDRRYFVDKWIRDQSLDQLLNLDYNLDYMNKNNLNKYINLVYLTEYKFYNKVIHKVKSYENNLTRTTFYYFTKTSSIPKYFSTKSEWQQVYDNFMVLRCNSNESNKGKVDKLNDDVNLSTSTPNSYDNINLVSLPSTNNKRLTDIQNLVRTNFFHTKEVKVLFNCRNNEAFYSCLSRIVDHFNLILNNEVNISTTVNKADKKDCELNPQQTNLMLHHMQYLQFTYLKTLEKASVNNMFNF